MAPFLHQGYGEAYVTEEFSYIQKYHSFKLNYKSAKKKMMLRSILFTCFSLFCLWSQETPSDYLTAEFHADRRAAVRQKLPPNSVAVFFANPVRNRANDVDFHYHQDPNFTTSQD